MSVLLKYIASSGNEYNLKTDGIRTKTANYHVWNWGAETTALQFGVRVANFKRDAAVYETQLIFNGSYMEAKALIEALHQDFENDIRTMSPGRIIWGDSYIDCYITESSTQPNPDNIWPENDLTIYCPYPFWVRELKKTFFSQEAPPETQSFLDYEYDYEYDYFLSNIGTDTWAHDFPFTSEFLMTVYGPVANPRILINGYPYQFFDTLESTEYVTIDSRNNTIRKHLANGQAVSIFDLRNKAQSIFEPIPAGNLTINWTGLFGFDITLFEERSEPRWTAR